MSTTTIRVEIFDDKGVITTTNRWTDTIHLEGGSVLVRKQINTKIVEYSSAAQLMLELSSLNMLGLISDKAIRRIGEQILLSSMQRGYPQPKIIPSADKESFNLRIFNWVSPEFSDVVEFTSWMNAMVADDLITSCEARHIDLAFQEALPSLNMRIEPIMNDTHLTGFKGRSCRRENFFDGDMTVN